MPKTLSKSFEAESFANTYLIYVTKKAPSQAVACGCRSQLPLLSDLRAGTRCAPNPRLCLGALPQAGLPPGMIEELLISSIRPRLVCTALTDICVGFAETLLSFWQGDSFSCDRLQLQCCGLALAGV